jgi:hypothetical protein
MSPYRQIYFAGAFTALTVLGTTSAMADDDFYPESREIKHVFVIAMENHNWTQPATVSGAIEPIFGNPNAPFINSLVNGTAQAFINGHLVSISKQVAYAAAYHNVLATPNGNNPHIHPSEPNYLWAEAGTNFGVFSDADPYTGGTNQNTDQHLTGLLQKAGKTWKSYQEDTDLQTNAAGQLINIPRAPTQWTVPLTSFSGTFGPSPFLNESNDTLQYNYAPKHNPQVFFSDTNGGNNATPSNPLSHHYAPLQALASDLAANRIADYVWITPNQYNDQHTSLHNGFAGLTGDAANIAQGDNALSRLVPLIMSSKAYREGGVIVLWWDESEQDGVSGDNPDDFNHTLGEIVISPLAHANVSGLPYASPLDFTHSSDLRTWQEVFQVRASGSSPFLGDAANVNDLSDLFEPGVIPTLR